MALDISKGALLVGLAYQVWGIQDSRIVPVTLAPVAGHAFSPFLRGMGGKALATAFSVWIGLSIWSLSLPAATFRVTGCLDVARVDFRLDASDDNKPYILEVNPLPGLNPEYSDLSIEAQAEGWSYDELINRILDESIERQELSISKSEG